MLPCMSLLLEIEDFFKTFSYTRFFPSSYWTMRMFEGGEDPLFIARRFVRIASEDIGLADPHALTQAVSTMQGCQCKSTFML